VKMMASVMDMKRTPIAQSDCVREGVLNLSIGMSLPGSMEGRWEGLEPLRSDPRRSDPLSFRESRAGDSYRTIRRIH